MRNTAIFAVLAVTMTLGVMNTLGINAASIYQFGTGQSITVSANYSFGGPNPQAMTLFPGTGASTNNFTLSIHNYARGTVTTYVYFQPSNPTEWTLPGASTVGLGCSTTQQGIYTMHLNGVITAPQNATNFPSNGCSSQNSYPAAVQSIAVTVAPGTTTVTGGIDVDGTANAGEAFSISWLASTAQPA